MCPDECILRLLISPMTVRRRGKDSASEPLIRANSALTVMPPGADANSAVTSLPTSGPRLGPLA